MCFVEMLRKITILQRFMIIVSIIWLLLMIDKNCSRSTCSSFDIGDFVSEGFIPVIAVWGLYWIIIEIVRKWKTK